MRKGIRTRQTIILTVCILLFSSAPLWATDSVCKITATNATVEGSSIKYTITGSTTPTYKVLEKFAPFRLVMDIAGADFTAPPKAVPENSFVKMESEDLSRDTGHGKRLIFTLADSHDYDVSQSGNMVIITFTPEKGAALPIQSDSSSVATTSPSATTTINDFRIAAMPNRTTISIRANRQIDDYAVDKLAEPGKLPRMFIDIEDADINGLPREKVIDSKLVSKIRVAPKGNGIRIIFDSAATKMFAYSVNPAATGLDVVISDGAVKLDPPPSQKPTQHPIKKTAAVTAPKIPATASQPPPPKKESKKDNRLDALISSSEKNAAKDPETVLAQTPTSKLTTPGGSFSLSGYEAQRITVDFYKIDIHNVFRLFREITDLNIIVDENVKGSLTLALNDVPWDFALDIILNLMKLKKEERFNTIVIYPAELDGKPNTFTWPTRAADNLSFQPDMDIIGQDALVVEKTQNQPAEVLKAQELLQQARLLEKQDNLEDAVLLYDKALSLWPDNRKISNRLATIHLVNLGMNAKALFYADCTLRHHPEDRSAALYAAIASANMQRLPQANEYFIRSTSDTPPMKEALMSYAAFCENNSMNEASIKLLTKFEKHYGENVNTMIAKARILDKTGQRAEAKRQYQAALASGYQMPPALRHYIQQRVQEEIQ